MAKKKTKPYKSLASNMLWSTKKQFQYAPLLLVMLVVQTPINVALAYADIYLPSLVVSEVTTNQTIYHAAHSVGLLMLLMLIGRLVQNVFFLSKQNQIGILRRESTFELRNKCLNCFYQIYESKKMRDLSDRATKAVEMWNGVQPISDMPKQIWSLVESILKYFLFGTVASFVSPWL